MSRLLAKGRILSGVPVAGVMRERTKRFIRKYGLSPGLAIVTVGKDGISQSYIRAKKRAAGEVGIRIIRKALKGKSREERLLGIIEGLNKDEDVDGIIVQLPLPGHVDTNKVIEAIDPGKDVDGFHPFNIGGLLLGDNGRDVITPATPLGIMEILYYYDVDLVGSNAVVVGRSNIVGKPVGMLLLEHGATVTICHSMTVDLGEHTRRADILVVAAGSPGLVDETMVKEGACVIDVGINRDTEGKISGDVDFDRVIETADCTPVPGGVGLVTVESLMCNTATACFNRTH